jgi:glycosyltransferase involved in cell wall biosynthesis
MQMTYVSSDITIIITCYKEGELLRRAVASVEAQTAQGFAVILVNDCSPDALTNAICDELALKEGVTYVRHDLNGGLSKARNTGFATMTNTIAMPLDADDTLPPDAVADTIRTFNAHPEADMVFGGYAIINPNTGASEVEHCDALVGSDGKLDVHALAQKWVLMGQSPCTKALWERIDGYSSKFTNTVQDVDFWRRAIQTGAKGAYTDTVIYHWYRAEDGMNASVREEDYLPLRIDSVPFYDRFNPKYGHEMRQYIYRYYAARLMAQELNAFLKLPHGDNFTFIQRIKAKLMYVRPLYVALRHLHNLVRPTQ